MASGLVFLIAAVLVIAAAATPNRRAQRCRAERAARSDVATLTLRIDALLPQTQCRRCGFSGCRPYADAIAAGNADINQCPPGGDKGIRKLAALLGRDYKPLNPRHGEEKPRTVAFIDEPYCIGCTLCIQACPVDAIVGAAKQMHTIVAELCTGCELCVPVCPVDCIRMVPPPVPAARWQRCFPLSVIFGTRAQTRRADTARARYEFHEFRAARDRQEKAARLAAQTVSGPVTSGAEQDAAGLATEDRKKALIAAAMARAQLQKAQVKPANTAALTPEQQAKIAEIEARRTMPQAPETAE